MKKILFILGILSVFCFSCFEGQDKGTGVFKPSSAGKLYEIITVIEPELWTGTVGAQIEKYFMQPMIGLPQPESLFKMRDIKHSSFNKMFKSHRNILNIRVSDYVDSVGVKILRDFWASPQIYVEVTARNQQEFDSLMDKKGNQILNIFLVEEKKRLQSAYKKMEDQSIRRAVLKKQNIIINVPAQYRLDVNKKDFVWISNETPRLSQGILIWTYPYTNEKQLTKNELILARDSVLLRNVPGAEPESYMGTEHRWPPALFNKTHNGCYAIEMRGLWVVEGDFMGGPFVNLTMIDTTRGRIVTVEGYVYAGKQTKRNFIRELEAIIYTADIAEPR